MSDLREKVIATLTPDPIPFRVLYHKLGNPHFHTLRRTLVALEVEQIADLISGTGWRIDPRYITAQKIQVPGRSLP